MASVWSCCCFSNSWSCWFCSCCNFWTSIVWLTFLWLRSRCCSNNSLQHFHHYVWRGSVCYLSIHRCLGLVGCNPSPSDELELPQFLYLYLDVGWKLKTGVRGIFSWRSGTFTVLSPLASREVGNWLHGVSGLCSSVSALANTVSSSKFSFFCVNNSSCNWISCPVPHSTNKAAFLAEALNLADEAVLDRERLEPALDFADLCLLELAAEFELTEPILVIESSGWRLMTRSNSPWL